MPFLRRFALALGLQLALIAGFNLVVDPFGFYGLVERPGLNRCKPALQTYAYARLAKLRGLEVFRPKTVLMGTSRVAVGLAPADPATQLRLGRTFNLALPVCSIDEALGLAQAAGSDSELVRLVVGLDLGMFTELPGVPALKEPALPPLLQDLRRYRDTLLTRDSLEASLQTLRGQVDCRGEYRGDGFQDGGWLDLAVSRRGHRQLARGREQEWARLYLELARTPEQAFGQRLQVLDTLLAWAGERGLEVRLFVNPAHARYLEVISAAGALEILENWKRALAATVARASRNGVNVELWDFATYHELTAEPFPPLGDLRARMHGYWESSHYQPVVGRLIVARMFPGGDDVELPEGFGVRLEPENVEAHLAAVRRAALGYREFHPEEAAEVHAAVRRAAAELSRSARTSN